MKNFCRTCAVQNIFSSASTHSGKWSLSRIPQARTRSSKKSSTRWKPVMEVRSIEYCTTRCIGTWCCSECHRSMQMVDWSGKTMRSLRPSPSPCRPLANRTVGGLKGAHVVGVQRQQVGGDLHKGRIRVGNSHRKSMLRIALSGHFVRAHIR